MLLVVDLLGLGLHLADTVANPFADDAPTHAKVRVGGPDAVVPNTAVAGADASRQAARTAEPLGCLALNSGCYAGPPAPTATGNTATAPTPSANGGSPTTTTPKPKPKPIAQADVGVPALGAQVSLGVGDGGCTGLALTVLAVGDCPTASGDGPVVVNLGGSLLGQ